MSRQTAQKALFKCKKEKLQNSQNIFPYSYTSINYQILAQNHIGGANIRSHTKLVEYDSLKKMNNDKKASLNLKRMEALSLTNIKFSKFANNLRKMPFKFFDYASYRP